MFVYYKNYDCVDQLKSGIRIKKSVAFETKPTFILRVSLTIYYLLTLKEPLVITAVIPVVIVAVVPEKVPATYVLVISVIVMVTAGVNANTELY